MVLLLVRCFVIAGTHKMWVFLYLDLRAVHKVLVRVVARLTLVDHRILVAHGATFWIRAEGYCQDHRFVMPEIGV